MLEVDCLHARSVRPHMATESGRNGNEAVVDAAS